MELFSESHWGPYREQELGQGEGSSEGGTLVPHPPGFSQERLPSNTHGPSPILPTQVGR